MGQRLGLECGAGILCECNRAGEHGIDEPDMSGILVPEKVYTKH
jgi:hypothetical protein